jgi:hypothetical protein
MPKAPKPKATERAKVRKEARQKKLEAVFDKAWKHVVKHYTAIQPPQNLEGKRKC